MLRRFRNRTQAGKLLAAQLTEYANRPDVLVLGLPRGGVPVAYEVAKELDAPLDVCLVRKLGVPGHKELAMGAIATGGVRVINENVVDWLRISPETINQVAAIEMRELDRRSHSYRGNLSLPKVKNHTIILVDENYNGLVYATVLWEPKRRKASAFSCYLPAFAESAMRLSF